MINQEVIFNKHVHLEARVFRNLKLNEFFDNPNRTEVDELVIKFWGKHYGYNF